MFYIFYFFYKYGFYICQKVENRKKKKKRKKQEIKLDSKNVYFTYFFVFKNIYVRNFNFKIDCNLQENNFMFLFKIYI